MLLNPIKGSHHGRVRFHHPVRNRLSYDQSYSTGPSSSSLRARLLSMHKMTSSDPSTPRLDRTQLIGEAARVRKRSSSLKRDEVKTGKAPKAWSSEDERILLQSRLQRVPYKQIGARLGKTDLACRLHFHQMITARKDPEAPPGRSIVFLSSEHPPEIHRLTPFATKPNVGDEFHSRSSSRNTLADNSNLTLPKIVEHPHRRSHSYPDAYINQTSEWQPNAMLAPLYSQTRNISPPIGSGQQQNMAREHMNDSWPETGTRYSGPDRIEAGDLNYPYYAGPSADPMFSQTYAGPAMPTQPPQLTVPRQQWLHPPPQQYNDGNNVQSPGRCSVESLLNHRG